MSDPSPDGPRPGGWVPPPADPNRDIRLPPLPDRPAPAVRPEWAAYVPAPQPAPPAQVGTDAPVTPAPVTPAPVTTGAAGPPPARPTHDLPTDRLASPHDRPRSSTLSFQPPPPVQLLKVSVGANPRRGRWLWALVILVPLAIIIGSGTWLLVLFYGG